MRSKIGSLCLRYRRFAIALSQAMMIVLALQAAFLLRYDLGIPITEIEVLRQALWVAVPVKMAVFVGARLHKGWWQFAGTRELLHIALGNVGASVAFAVVARALVGPRLPRAVYLIDFLLCFLGTAAARFAVRVYNELFSKELRSQAGSKGLLIYGAGVAGRMLVHEIRSNPSLGYHVLGFIDDDPRKRSLEFMGVQVHGTGREAAQVVDRLRGKSRRVEEIIIAMPTANGRQMQEAIGNCRGAEVSCKTLPGIRELLAGQVLNKQIRDLSVDDLLGRQEVQLDEQRIAQQICGRVVLVTGAAGSIGSELCRQLARYNPAKIVAFDIAESELYKLDLELRTRFPQLDNVVEIGSICDGERLREVLRANRVECVFHAAAYKHVPLMEVHVLEAVRNNVLGTWTLLEAARSSGVRNFLMISSDKAVNPVSVMGATKRAAELIVSSSKSAMTAVSGTIRQCSREQWKRIASVPGADRSRRAGQGHASGHLPVLYEPARGGAARFAGFRHGSRRGDFHPGHGRADQDRRSGDEHDSAERAEARRRHRDSFYWTPAGRAIARRAHDERRARGADLSLENQDLPRTCAPSRGDCNVADGSDPNC